MAKKLSNTSPKTINESDPMSSIKMKLKTSDSEIQYYIAALETENIKLNVKIAQLQAENATLKGTVKALAEENEKQKRELLPKPLSPDLQEMLDSVYKTDSTK
ncbi:MAG: hypothetical protein KKD92_00430 [Proteobacteria bacterium]|nr:hypothetical protein [Pseudomonadota bacterium]